MLPNNLPLIEHLPLQLVADSWEWRKMEHYDHWIGTDEDGKEWLVKMSGSFYSYRERTFASLAQHLGLSCQSSVYLHLPPDSLPMKNKPRAEVFQLAICWYEQHDDNYAIDCPIKVLYEKSNDPLLNKMHVLKQSSVKNSMDYARAEILAYLCGANERYEFIYTKNHELIMVDNEQTFSSAPCNVLDIDIIKEPDGNLSPLGKKIVHDLCKSFSRISDEDIEMFTSKPNDYKVKKLWKIKPKLFKARKYAGDIVRVCR